MRTALLMPVLLLAATNAHAGEQLIGNGELASESRKISEVSEVEASGGVKLDVKQGPPSLVVETDRNLLPYVRTEVKGQRLVIGYAPNTSIRSSKGLKATLTVPSLSGVSGSGGVQFNIDVPLVKAAKIDASGGAVIEASKVDADVLAVDASGGVELHLRGKAAAANLDLSGGVQVKAPSLAVKSLKVDASGGCTAELAVSDAVQGDLSGGVDLLVHGKPQVSVSRSGGASVRLRD